MRAKSTKAEPTPGPWFFSESKDGKWYAYGPDNAPIIVPNMSATGRSKEEVTANFRLMVTAVNEYRENLRRAKAELGGRQL